MSELQPRAMLDVAFSHLESCEAVNGKGWARRQGSGQQGRQQSGGAGKWYPLNGIVEEENLVRCHTMGSEDTAANRSSG